MGTRRSAGRRPIYVPSRRDLEQLTHIAKVMGKGESQVGKMDAMLTDPHLDTRIKICILMNVVIPKLEYAGEVWEGNAQFRK